MLDDPGKCLRGEREMRDLVEAEIERICAYARFVIEATPYQPKTLRVFPALAHMPTRVMRALEAEGHARGMDLKWDGRTRTCVLRIHAPPVGPVGKKGKKHEERADAEEHARERAARAELGEELGHVPRDARRHAARRGGPEVE